MGKRWSKAVQRDPFYSTKAWQRVRREALKRDDYTCQYCMAHGVDPPATATEVHHIMTKREHPELALELDNLVSLCWQCHESTKQRRRSRTQERISRSGVRVIQV